MFEAAMFEAAMFEAAMFEAAMSNSPRWNFHSVLRRLLLAGLPGHASGADAV
jgi:hypothetical protein